MYAVLPPTSELQAVTVSHRQQYNSIRYEDMISAILIAIVIVIIILTVIYEETIYKRNQCCFGAVPAFVLKQHLKIHFGEKTHKCSQAMSLYQATWGYILKGIQEKTSRMIATNMTLKLFDL